MSITFSFTYEGKVTQLPVNPAEFAYAAPGDNESENILTLGEVTIIKRPKLTVMTIDSFFPLHDNAPYVLTKSDFKEPIYYVRLFNYIRANGKPTQLTVTDTDIDTLVTVEGFEVRYIAQNNDIYYTLDLKAYKPFNALVYTPPKTNATAAATTTVAAKAQAEPERSNTAGKIAIGSKVIVNGRLYGSSYGESPGATKTNFTGVIENIKTGRQCPYHVSTLAGLWQGWVKPEAVALA